jgi:DNA repair protein RecN (Recombination protein N)
MLRELRIRNLAVIEDVVVPLEAGLNVLSGETGAGKSILVDAILLILGARAQPELIRSGQDTGLVEAVFDISVSSPVAVLLDEAGHSPSDGQLVLKRELARSGRHRVFINDGPATVGLLERVGDLLVELHGQHEHQRLLEPSRQLDVLDRFAEAVGQRDRVTALVRRWDEARGALLGLREEIREHARQEDLYRFQISEIDAGRLRDGEEEELRAELKRLQHAERICATLEEAMGLLHEDDQSAAARLGRAGALLRGLARIETGTADLLPGLEAALAQVEDVVAGVRGLRDRAVADPDRQDQIETRLDALAKLKRKYGETETAVLAHREAAAAGLDRLASHDLLVAERERELAALAAAAEEAALELSGTREKAARRLERLVEKEIRALGMEHARLRIALSREAAGADQLRCGAGEWRIGLRGAETAEFLVSANPGEDLRPLAKVISGGELSRAMLAVKTILAAADDTPTLVFDEVDAGIGGRVADVVGQRLRQSAAGRQVLCVTHLAPIAAHATHHLLVDKRVTRGATRTTVTALDEAARVEELARMLGGERVTDASRRHARELRRSARGSNDG